MRQVKIVNYSKAPIPADYRCDDCLKHGVQLWRHLAMKISDTPLLCSFCAEARERSWRGENWKSLFSRNLSTSIGDFVPAIPIEGENSFWGNTSIPENRSNWWKNLPVK
jgi:hypothetical protein